MLSVNRSEHGQGVVMVLILLGLAGMFALVWSSMRDQHYKIARHLDHKQSAENLRRQLSIALNDGLLCGCIPSLQTETFNADAPEGTQVVPVSHIPSSCAVVVPPPPPIVQQGDILDGMRIARIELANLRPDAPMPTTLWVADWRVHFDPGGGPGLKPVTLSQRITVSGSTGPVSITACAPQAAPGASPLLIDSCPSGWTLVGPPGLIGSYCITTARRGPLPQNVALDECAQQQPSTGGTSHLCDHSEWLFACTQGAFTDAGTAGEWVTEFHDMSRVTIAGVSSDGATTCTTGGASMCQRTCHRPRSSPTYYRCCYP